MYTVTTLKIGQISLMPRPRGGEWLAGEMNQLKTAGAEVLVSLLSRAEVLELELAEEAAFCRASGIEFLDWPITDRGCPPFSRSTFDFIEQLAKRLGQDQHVVVHCLFGIGRSALIAASTLVASGLSAEDAFKRLEAARGRPVPDTFEQREWVERFEQYLKRTNRQ